MLMAKPKRPRDPNQLAKVIADIATGEGPAKAETLSPAERGPAHHPGTVEVVDGLKGPSNISCEMNGLSWPGATKMGKGARQWPLALRIGSGRLAISWILSKRPRLAPTKARSVGLTKACCLVMRVRERLRPEPLDIGQILQTHPRLSTAFQLRERRAQHLRMTAFRHVRRPNR